MSVTLIPVKMEAPALMGSMGTLVVVLLAILGMIAKQVCYLCAWLLIYVALIHSNLFLFGESDQDSGNHPHSWPGATMNIISLLLQIIVQPFIKLFFYFLIFWNT